MSSDTDVEAETVAERVDEIIGKHEVVVFMKGNPMMPQCGYSERAVSLIDEYRDDYAAVDVLPALDEFRAALAERSGWETIPQTFVDGEFVGGSDVLAELEERGELAATLGVEE